MPEHARDVDDRNVLDRFCEEFCAVIERHAKYIIVSGFMAIATGRVRGTEDIDMVLERLDEKRFRDLHEDLVAQGFVCMQSARPDEIYEYLTERLSVRYTRRDEPLPEMEVKFAKDELDDEQLATRKRIALTRLKVFFADINANIAFKEHYLKSDKDLEDARHLRIVLAENIDEREITRFKQLIDRCRP